MYGSKHAHSSKTCSTCCRDTPYTVYAIVPNGIVKRDYGYQLERFQLVNCVALHDSQVARLKHLIRPF